MTKIEVVEFYPKPPSLKAKNLLGTMHVFLEEEKIDIRGIAVIKKKNNWAFLWPSFKGYDPDTQKEIRYPVFQFIDHEKQKAFTQEIKRKGMEYIKENFMKNRKLKT